MTKHAGGRMKIKNPKRKDADFQKWTEPGDSVSNHQFGTALLIQTARIERALGAGKPILGFLLLALPVRLAVRVSVAHVLAVATAVRESLQTFL